MEPDPFQPIRAFCILLASAAGTVLLLVGINLAVDPYGVRPANAFMKLPLKSRKSIEKNEYLHKAYAIANEGPETVYFGNSRVCNGLPADDLLWKSKTYNCGLAAGGPEEIVAYLRHALNLGCVKRVVIGLDALGFLGLHRAPSAFDGSLLKTEPNSRMLPAVASPAIFSMGAVTDSLKSILRQRSAEKVSYPQGVRDADGMRATIHNDSVRASESALNLSRYQLREFAALDPRNDIVRVECAREMARLCRERSVEVILFFPPIPQTYLELIDAEGLTERLQNVQEQVVAAFEGAGLPSLAIYDFSHGQAHASDNQFENPDSKVWKRWGEVVHFRPEFGQEIVQQLALVVDAQSKAESALEVHATTPGINHPDSVKD